MLEGERCTFVYELYLQDGRLIKKFRSEKIAIQCGFRLIAEGIPCYTREREYDSKGGLISRPGWGW